MSWEIPERFHTIAHIHGALCATTVMLIFPVGAILLRTSNWYPVSLHKWTQLVGLIVYLAGFILSIILWTHLEDGFEWAAGPHGQLGLAVSVCVLMQVVIGLLNHKLFRMRYNRSVEGQTATSPQRSVLAWIHILLGWFIVVGGIVNGAIGDYHAVAGVG